MLSYWSRQVTIYSTLIHNIDWYVTVLTIKRSREERTKSWAQQTKMPRTKMSKIKDCCPIYGKNTHYFNKQEVCEGWFGCWEVDVNRQAADFASDPYSTSLPKNQMATGGLTGTSLCGGSGLCWGLAGMWGRQSAPISGVGSGRPNTHAVLVFHVRLVFAASSGIFCPAVLSSVLALFADPSFRGRNTISNSNSGILSMTSLALSFQANIIFSQHCFPSHLPPRTHSSLFPSTLLKWRGETWLVFKENMWGRSRQKKAKGNS